KSIEFLFDENILEKPKKCFSYDAKVFREQKRFRDTLFIAYFWLIKSQELVIDTFKDESNKIGGKDVVIQINKFKFSRHKYNCRRRVNGVWVIEGIEITNEKRCFLITLEKRNIETIQK
ncbi:8811_t:CDS:2, partial [Gigaspora margarita]